MNKIGISIEIDPTKQGAYKFKIQSDNKNSNYTYISLEGPLIKSVLVELGISSALIMEAASSELLESNVAIEVLIFVAWVEGEGAPLVDVYRSGVRLGGFSLDPLMLPNELTCVVVLDLLGYAVTLDGIEYF